MNLYQIKTIYPFQEGEHYFTIEDGEIVESIWDSISEELHHLDKQYFSTLEEIPNTNLPIYLL
jgi:hypothetical protein